MIVTGNSPMNFFNIFFDITSNAECYESMGNGSGSNRVCNFRYKDKQAMDSM